MSITTEVTQLPPAPQRSDAPADFIQKADAHVASLSQFVTELNQVTTEVNQTVQDAEDQTTQAVADAQDAAADASASAARAQDAAQAAQAAANFAGAWSNLTGAYSAGISAEHAGSIWLLLNDVADITASEPGVSSDWLLATSANESVVDPSTLTFAAVNEFQNSAVATMPGAATVTPNKFLDIYVAEKYKGVTITINATGADLFDDGEATDGQLVLDFPIGGYFRITSDGATTLRV